MTIIRGNEAHRFWRKVAIVFGSESDCWLWRAGRSKKGYAVFHRTVDVGFERQVGAHRMAWEFAFGPVPDGLFVCHKCDVRNCVRPSHLFIGTTADNMSDMVSKGRSRNQHVGRTHCTRGHAYTPDNIYRNPKLPNARWCRICAKERAQQSYLRNRTSVLDRMRRDRREARDAAR